MKQQKNNSQYFVMPPWAFLTLIILRGMPLCKLSFPLHHDKFLRCLINVCLSGFHYSYTSFFNTFSMGIKSGALLGQDRRGIPSLWWCNVLHTVIKWFLFYFSIKIWQKNIFNKKKIGRSWITYNTPNHYEGGCLIVGTTHLGSNFSCICLRIYLGDSVKYWRVHSSLRKICTNSKVFKIRFFCIITLLYLSLLNFRKVSVIHCKLKSFFGHFSIQYWFLYWFSASKICFG